MRSGYSTLVVATTMGLKMMGVTNHYDSCHLPYLMGLYQTFIPVGSEKLTSVSIDGGLISTYTGFRSVFFMLLTPYRTSLQNLLPYEIPISKCVKL